jgi:hypothetical protein
MTFIEEILQHGTLRIKQKKTYTKVDMRATFVEQAGKQIAAIKDGVVDKKGRHRGHWFEELDDGSYVIQLKNGTTPLKLRESKSEIHCKDSASAIAVIAAARNAATRGDLDAYLRAAARRKGAAANSDTTSTILNLGARS